ncbi:hypothetical protein, partial [Hymenobacter terricola]|uniref:hypothetical protein n=1 Tax=Hymenobacter terricola TaxID=2819236 RepID=UPI001CF20277
ASAALTGTPTAPTPAAGTNSTRLATTAFVQAVAGLLLSKANNLSDLQDKASAIANLGLAGWLVTQLAYFGVTNNVQEAALPAQSGSGFLRGVPLTLGQSYFIPKTLADSEANVFRLLGVTDAGFFPGQCTRLRLAGDAS